MNAVSLGLILISVLLSAGSQVLLKIGMSTPAVQATLTANGPSLASAWMVFTTPTVILGLACFGLSAISWLLVLSKIALSQAYPFVALGTLLTVAAAYFMLGEAVSPMRLAGVAAIAVGVVLVGFS